MADEEIVNLNGEEKLEVKVVDDTPVNDRGRTPIPEEILNKAVDDPLDEYSDKVKARINQLRKGVHDERRAKETAAREREEAVNYAKKVHEENQQLKQRLGNGEKVFITEVNKAATSEVASAKEALKRAYESGDSEKITDAQEKLTDAKIKLDRVSSFRPSLQEQEASVKTTQQQPAQQVAQPIHDPKAEAWKEKNEWFGPNKAMTALALGLHDELVEAGVDPRSDEYYKRVDATMKKRFPEQFEEGQETVEEKPPRKVSNVVAPASRSTAPRQVKITASEAAIARRLGLTAEAYAREKIKLENANG